MLNNISMLYPVPVNVLSEAQRFEVAERDLTRFRAEIAEQDELHQHADTTARQVLHYASTLEVPGNAKLQALKQDQPERPQGQSASTDRVVARLIGQTQPKQNEPEAGSYARWLKSERRKLLARKHHDNNGGTADVDTFKQIVTAASSDDELGLNLHLAKDLAGGFQPGATIDEVELRRYKTWLALESAKQSAKFGSITEVDAWAKKEYAEIPTRIRLNMALDALNIFIVRRPTFANLPPHAQANISEAIQLRNALMEDLREKKTKLTTNPYQIDDFDANFGSALFALTNISSERLFGISNTLEDISVGFFASSIQGCFQALRQFELRKSQLTTGEAQKLGALVLNHFLTDESLNNNIKRSPWER
jgi:hypothetical protein